MFGISEDTLVVVAGIGIILLLIWGFGPEKEEEQEKEQVADFGYRKEFIKYVVAVVAIFAGFFFYHLNVVNSYTEAKFGLPEGIYVKLNPITNVITFHVKVGIKTNLVSDLISVKMFASSMAGPIVTAIYEKLSKDKNDFYARIISYSINDEPKIDL